MCVRWVCTVYTSVPYTRIPCTMGLHCVYHAHRVCSTNGTHTVNGVDACVRTLWHTVWHTAIRHPSWPTAPQHFRQMALQPYGPTRGVSARPPPRIFLPSAQDCAKRHPLTSFANRMPSAFSCWMLVKSRLPVSSSIRPCLPHLTIVWLQFFLLAYR